MFCTASLAKTGGLAFGFAGTLGVIDISDIIHSFAHDKSSSISQLINGKSRDLQKILNYFSETTASMSNELLSFDVLHIIFAYIQMIYFLLFCCYLSYY